jgi:hypothetical protein
LLILSRFPVNAGGMHIMLTNCIQKFTVIGLAACLSQTFVTSAMAQQRAGSEPRAARVGVATVKTEVQANFTDVQARAVAGPLDTVTASTNAIIVMEKHKVGDFVVPGQLLARQNSETLALKNSSLKIKIDETKVKLSDLNSEIESELKILKVAKAQAKLLAGKAERAEDQERDKLRLRFVQLNSRLAETNLKLLDISSDIAAEADLLNVSKAQATLLDGKANRAKELAAQNTLPIDAAETAVNASLTARLQVLSRESSISRKETLRKTTQILVDQIQAEIEQLKIDINVQPFEVGQTALNASLAAQVQVESRESSVERKRTQAKVLKLALNQYQDEARQTSIDIEEADLKSTSKGQITYLADYRRGFAREGEVIAKILDQESFEVEAEIPLDYVPFVQSVKALKARSLDGLIVDLKLRTVLPVQNVRNATRTVRFEFADKVPASLKAVNAVLVLQVPVSSPSQQVIVPKDAVLPLPGGHMVYVLDGDKVKRQVIQLGSSVSNGFIVLKGLEAGQQVVVRGNEQLSDGKKVDVGGKPSTNKGPDKKKNEDKAQSDKKPGGKIQNSNPAKNGAN